MGRRRFIKLILCAFVKVLRGYDGITWGFRTNDSFQLLSTIKFGLGNDPERMTNAYDSDGKKVLDTLQPDIVCMWINGSKDNSGKIYSTSMEYVRDWAHKNRFKEWSELGHELMVITWENHDG